MQEMCNEAIRIDSYSMAFVPDRFKTQKMGDKAIEIDPFTLWHVPDNLKMREMCIRAVEAGLGLLGHVSDLFVTQQQVDVWYDGNIGITMMSLSSGIRAIKNGRPRKQRLRRSFYPLLGIPIV